MTIFLLIYANILPTNKLILNLGEN